MDLLQMVQIWYGVMHISRCHCHAQDYTVVRVQGLVAQVVLALRFPRPFHVACLRIRPAHSLVASAAVPLDLLCPLLPAVSSPFLQCLQSFFLVAVQPFPVYAWFRPHFHQMLRRPGSIGLYMGRVGGCQPPADQTFPDALTHHFLKQPTENLAERRLATAQLRDGAVVRYPVKKIQTQIPPQSHICLDALLNLPLRWDAVQVSYQQILHQHHWVDGRAAVPAAIQAGCFFLYEGQIQCGFQFSQKVSLWNQIFYRYHVQFQLHSHPPLRSFSHYIIFPALSGLCQQPQIVPKSHSVNVDSIRAETGQAIL